MRYWGYLIAKLTVAGAILLVLREAIVWMFHPARFAIDLAFTFAMLLFTLFATGLIWLIVWMNATAAGAACAACECP